MIDWIVAAITMIGAAFILLWFLNPSFRKRVEQPKFDMLSSSRRNYRSRY